MKKQHADYLASGWYGHRPRLRAFLQGRCCRWRRQNSRHRRRIPGWTQLANALDVLRAVMLLPVSSTCIATAIRLSPLRIDSLPTIHPDAHMFQKRCDHCCRCRHMRLAGFSPHEARTHRPRRTRVLAFLNIADGGMVHMDTEDQPTAFSIPASFPKSLERTPTTSWASNRRITGSASPLTRHIQLGLPSTRPSKPPRAPDSPA